MAPARLIEMGSSRFVASGIQCILWAKGLAHRLCEECKSPVHITAAELERSGLGSHEPVRTTAAPAKRSSNGE